MALLLIAGVNSCALAWERAILLRMWICWLRLWRPSQPSTQAKLPIPVRTMERCKKRCVLYAGNVGDQSSLRA